MTSTSLPASWVLVPSENHTLVKDLYQLNLEFEDAYAELVGAEACVFDAERELASVKAQLDTSKAELLKEGVEGGNREEREANLRIELHELYQELLACESELARTKLQLKVATKKWDMLRYRLRSLESVAKVRCG